jgi:outer membrane protein OmpA-like peptidoglycan-associated protein
MDPIRSRFTLPLLTLIALAAPLAADGAQQAAATPYRGSSGLTLHGSAPLAPAKILDLKSEPAALSRVVEDQNGTERRRDTNTHITYDLQAEVLFAKDSARLSNSARSRIGAIARAIAQQAATEVHVCGFTDKLGPSAHGDALSEQRAQTVQAVLADALHSPTVTITTRFGQRHPVASNATNAGRHKNRRVEISFPRTGG